MKRIIYLFLLFFTTSLFAQQLNYVVGFNTSGVALTGSFTNLDSTGGTSYTMVFTLDDYYPYDYNPFFLIDSSANSIAGGGASAQGNADKTSLGTWWYFIDVDDVTDSINFDIDVYTGVYGTESQMIAGVKWDPTPTNCADIVDDGDQCGGVLIYVETGKLLPPHVIKIVIDIDPTGKEVSAGIDVYYEFVHPAIYQVAKERK